MPRERGSSTTPASCDARSLAG